MTDNRLQALDAARGLAVLGMFAVHVGPRPEPSGAGYLLIAADGRAPAVFTLIAGFSLALARGGTRPRPGQPPLRATLIRCAVLALLGLTLAWLHTGILVILAFYAVYFLAAEPFTRLGAKVLIAVASCSVVLGPVLSYTLGPLFGHRLGGRGATPAIRDLAGWTGLAEAVEALLLSGAYPLLTYFPYLLVGMALGRIADLRRPGPARLLVGWGAAGAVAGYGLSWLAVTGPGNGYGALLRAVADHHPAALAADDPVRAVLGQQYGAIPSTSWHWLLVADPYSQTPLETLGNAGVGAALIGLAVGAARSRLLAGPMRPLAAVGAMALSVYVAHALALAGFAHRASGWQVLAAFCAAALLGCLLWQRLWRGTEVRRGPLEWALRTITSRPVGPRRKARVARSQGVQQGTVGATTRDIW
ncbi:heparan-alpha-glucosaminide N-acetyltransferase domain-containing protein [Streptomyces sp. HUAS TT7]|uniref:heparan-alpha-glucosaminide N-acetyltransferase domain-containing protein n=1 Tax=Streptomyces sp. HUAS TT7 TaxID=3447507 RepID=UPI003F657E29